MLPWGEMLRAALAAGLFPEAFWRLSLREWRWLAGSGASPAQKSFEALMTRFPDERET
ncbi:MAG: phage tail assembly chaperone [Hyphomonas sp.]